MIPPITGLRFGYIKPNIPPVQSYSRPLYETNPNLTLRAVPPSGQRPFDWLFAHRGTSQLGAHTLTVIEDKGGKEYVHLLVTERPTLGGKRTLELPAGLVGDEDSDETILQAACRETTKETGLTVDKMAMLTQAVFAESPGSSTQLRALAYIHAKGSPHGQDRDPDEKAFIVGHLNVPLGTFTGRQKFIDWMETMSRDHGYLISSDILEARALMPKSTGKRKRLFRRQPKPLAPEGTLSAKDRKSMRPTKGSQL